MWPFSRKKELSEAMFPVRKTASDVALPVITATDSGIAFGGSWSTGYHDGEKFAGESGFGGNTHLCVDYWALRTKSAEVFERNLYARGLLRRLVTNIIVTGLELEACPFERALGMPEGALDEWTDSVEEQFSLWANDPKLCDFRGEKDFAELQRTAVREALVDGDILVVRRHNAQLGVPQIELVDGKRVATPMDAQLSSDRDIIHGVELDSSGRQIAYWVLGEDGKHTRLAAFGASGERIAWLFYASDKRMGEVRGMPILAAILQSLKEIDRYRDSAQRKAVVNSMVALFVEKSTEGMGTKPLTGASLRSSVRSQAGEGGQGNLSYKSETLNPGLAIDRLAPGETIRGFPTVGADASFADFEAGILNGIAWALEIPPEILRLSFNSNYSASQAANHEFWMVLSVFRSSVGKQLCQPFYQAWLVSEVLAERVRADGLLDARRGKTGADRYQFSAWLQADWNGQVKPSTDVVKLMRGLESMLNNGLVSHDMAARLTNGSKWSRNVKKQRRERELAKEAGVPLGGVQAVTEPEEPAEESEPEEDEDE